jgi:hypothetical protein
MIYKDLKEFKKELRRTTANICGVNDDGIIDYYYDALLNACEDYHKLKSNLKK